MGEAERQAVGQGELLVDDRFAIDRRRALGPVGGLEAVAARDISGEHDACAAIRLPIGIPSHPYASAFHAQRLPGLTHAYAQAVLGGDRWAVIGQPPCPAVGAPDQPRWTEAALMNMLLRPVGETLVALQAQGLTHRAVRADNVYASPMQRAVLGPCWLAAPGWHQDVRAEPLALAVCAPPCRGAGSIADDVYALGALLLQLHLGHALLPGLSDQQVIARKLELGSLEALLGEDRPGPSLLDLLRSMLADDPDQRPAPRQLMEIAVGRQRRGVRRAMARSKRPLQVGQIEAWTPRMLAWGLGSAGPEAIPMLRSGAISHWLRRSADQPAMATRLDDLTIPSQVDAAQLASAELRLLKRAVAILDPTAPQLWDGVWFHPGAFGAMLHHAVMAREPAAPVTTAVLGAILGADAIAAAATGAERATEDLPWVHSARRWVAEAGGVTAPMLRLLYVLNPDLACLSPALAGTVRTPAALLAALEDAAARGAYGGEEQSLFDDHLGAFLLARDEAAAARPELSALRRRPALRDLIRLAGLQVRWSGPPCPALARHLLPAARQAVEDWPGTRRRLAQVKALEDQAARGDLITMLGTVTDDRAREADAASQTVAWQRAAALRGEVDALQAARASFPSRARQLAGEVGLGAGLLTVAAVAATEWLG